MDATIDIITTPALILAQIIKQRLTDLMISGRLSSIAMMINAISNVII